MTTRKDMLVLTLIAGMILGGGGLKLVRYSASTAPDANARTSDVAIVTQAMTAGGWQRTGIESGPRIPFTSIAFAKQGCERQITISILGDSLELMPLARRVHGEDVVFSDPNGAQPDGGTGPLAIRLKRAASESGFARPRAPLLAIAPASALTAPGCAVPL